MVTGGGTGEHRACVTRVLYQNERGHDAQAVRQASAMLRERGVSLGLQQMVGLYSSTLQDEYARWNSFWRVSRKPFESIPQQCWRVQSWRRIISAAAIRSCHRKKCWTIVQMPLCRCHHAGVRVIRLGLHDTPSLREHLLAGYFHPAYGELAESRLYLRQLKAAAADCGKPELFVETAPRTMSKVLGQHVQPEGTGGAGRFASCTGKCCRCCGNDSDGAAGL